MMAAALSIVNITENGGDLQNIKSPSKSPAPNRIGRRNQESKEEKSSYICPLCEKACGSQHQLTMHIRQHNTDVGGTDHSCSICGKSLSSASSLDRHMLVHSGERPYKCSVCGQSFTTNGNMHRHMKIHEKDPNSVISISPPSPFKRRRLSAKRKLSHEAETEDPMPAKKVVEESRPSEPVKKNAEDIFHCPVCFKEFTCKFVLETHMEAHPETTLRCDICCITFRTHRGLVRHNAVIHKQLPKDPSGKPFIQNNPSIAAGFHDLGFTDFSCRKFPIISQVWCETNLRRCISEFHRFVCESCNKAFPMFSALKLHKETHQQDQENEEQKLDSKDLANKDLEQKAFMASLGLQYTKEIKPVHKEDPTPHDFQAVQFETLKCNLPQEPGSTSMSPLEASSVGGPFSAFPHTKENVKLLSLQPFQKGFIIQPNSSIVVKPISTELADIQQILKMASSAPTQISLPPLPKACPGAAPHIFKSMPPLKPKPLVAPRTMVAASTPPPLLNAQQPSPGCTSPSLPPPRLRVIRNSVESASNASYLQSRSGTKPPSPTAQLSLQPKEDPLSQNETETPLDQDNITDTLLPLDLESKNKDETAERDFKAMMSGAANKKSLAMRKVLYPCRFCDQVFAFSGVLRAHVRTHLGISPYQCNICDYIAADKAALIRHLRTHSGERPYICKICHYPFTVKANCERHLRKKHLKMTRKDIEKNIEYISSNTPEMVDAFCSPDTVCRYCGDDLKHYRALRMHMRTHSGLQKKKPFACKECGTTFSAKRNCIHHILKQHLHIQEKEIENHILMVDCNPEEDKSESLPSGENTYLDQKPTVSSLSCLEPHNGFVHEAVPNFPIKLESTSSFPQDLDEPLDFSQKNKSLCSVQVKQEDFYSSSPFIHYDCSMEPIDLSIPKNRKDKEKETPVETSKQEQVSEPGNQLNNHQQCSPAFSVNGNSDRQVLLKHSQPLNGPLHLTVPIISPAIVSNSSFLRPLRPKPPLLLPKPPGAKELPPLASIAQIISSVSSASALLKTDVTDSNLLKANSAVGSEKSGTPKSKVTIMAAMQTESSFPGNLSLKASSPDVAEKLAAVGMSGLTKKRGRKKGTKNKPKIPAEQDLESSGEFASIEKMLATTDTNKFSPFLQNTDGVKEEDDQHGTSEDEREAAEDKLLKGKRNSYSNSLQKIICPYCPRVFPWASSLQRHMLTHTDSQSDLEVQATGSDVLDVAFGEKVQVPGLELQDSKCEPREKQKVDSSPDGEDDTDEKMIEDKEELEDDTVSNRSLDLNFASKLMDFKLATSDQSSTGAFQKEKKNTCDICGKSFKLAATLGRHKKAHLCENKEEEKNSEDESRHGQKGVNGAVQELGPAQGTQEAGSPVDLKVPGSPVECEATEKNESSANLSETETSERKKLEKNDKEPKTNVAKGPTKADKRKKICTVCNKRFWSLQDLTRHMRSHTGERPYRCQTCERTFTLKHSLVRHQRIHQKIRDLKNHRGESEEDSEQESIHSGTNHMSESESDPAPGFGNNLSVTKSQKHIVVDGALEDPLAGELKAIRTSSASLSKSSKGLQKQNASRGQDFHCSLQNRESPDFNQDLLEIHEKSPTNCSLIVTDSNVPQLLGTE
uniref:Ras-responsive element-binding protein 1 n=1 Tax=Geotrypetes seraphini TaxID=260995 RepID=A0A6P8Q367_GEOSA|nr:ras-responsive element-binding protein 1 isoform X2 [Geotrypetes seraphini]